MAGLPGGVAPNRPNAASETRARLTALAALRAPFYRRAGAEVEVTGRPATEVADLLLEVARKQAGWP